MTKAINRVGAQYGELTVVRKSHKDKTGMIWWECKCTCGKSKTIRANGLLGGTKSCGCLHRKAVTTHGLRKHPLYSKWNHMIHRCYSGPKTNKQWWDYGGRGIRVCSEWRKNPIAFVEWGESNGYESGMELDREDNDGDYTPTNCRFVTGSVNRINQRRIKKNNTSGFRGVTWHKQNGYWCWNVSYNKKRYSRGKFKTREEAAVSRNTYIEDNGLPSQLMNTMRN